MADAICVYKIKNGFAVANRIIQPFVGRSVYCNAARWKQVDNSIEYCLCLINGGHDISGGVVIQCGECHCNQCDAERGFSASCAGLHKLGRGIIKPD